jgi:hypothetical protein
MVAGTVIRGASSGGGGGPTRSSFRIVPSPWLSTIVALTGDERLSMSVSFGSTKMSPRTWTVTVRAIWPAANVLVVAGIAM